MKATEMIVHDNASNMLGIYNIEDFPDHCIAGRCICHVLNLVIEVNFSISRLVC